jgi:hypothetical protein
MLPAWATVLFDARNFAIGATIGVLGTLIGVRARRNN